jgi:hypothetical protein
VRGPTRNRVSYRRDARHSGAMTTDRTSRHRVGRPKKHSSCAEARRAENARRKAKLKGNGLAQRSVWLPRELWDALRTARLASETSDAATLERLLRKALE